MNKLLKGINDLATTHKQLLLEWDYEKNIIKPDEIMAGSGKKVWWVCLKGHSYEQVVNAHKYGQNCPICSNQKILKGYNDFASKYPDLLKEWDFEKNIINPDEITAGSRKTVYWKCSNGHSWQTQIANRTIRHSDCPECNKGHQTSFSEQLIYYYLKSFGAVNRYKYNGKEIDIYLPKQNIGIEYLGLYYHSSSERKKKDREKELFLSSNNINMFYIYESTKNYKYKNKIYFDCRHKYETNLLLAVNKLFKILKFNIKIDLDKDRQEIYKLSAKMKKENSFANKFPNLLKEWDYEKNKIQPDQVSPYSSYKVFWKCVANGHSWEAIIKSRVYGNGCPYCANRAFGPKKIFIKEYPEIIPYLDLKKNKEDNIDINSITIGSHTRIWVRCLKNHLFKLLPHQYSRLSKNTLGCPYCTGKKIWPGYNDFASLYPNLAKEWDKNNVILPTEVSPSSHKIVSWRCSKGHKYKTMICNRTDHHMSCPICLRE